ncbi:hypothetical protein MTR67_027947, partial [Solanum verrucosum]
MAKNNESMNANPPGILLIRSIRRKDWSFKTYKYVVLLITFIAYTSYHASRKPSSIVKSVLHPHPFLNETVTNPWPIGPLFVKREFLGSIDLGKSKKKGWEPFNGEDGTSKLGEIDVAFLACYSMGMYVAGHLGDSLDLRLFLATGMIGSGIFVGLFGMGYFWNIHAFWFYLVMQMVAGLFQATGWPSVVAVIGNWFGKSKRGLIMGIWNAHTSVGNISGSLMAAAVLEYGWGWSFIVPGAFIFLAGIMVYLLLPAYPEDVGFPCPNQPYVEDSSKINDEEAQTVKENVAVNAQFNVPRVGSNRTSVGLCDACLIPGVIPFALCLFFSKLVAYTFLYWLPFYLSQTGIAAYIYESFAVLDSLSEFFPFFFCKFQSDAMVTLLILVLDYLFAAIGGEYVSVKSAGNLSALFDVGGIVGGILAGHLSDKLDARATTAASFMYAAIPSMLLYRKYGGTSRLMNILLMMIAGLFVNGPYALITTAVSADLGTHSSLKGDSRALATVTAIIDGTGSMGAALGPLLTGFLSSKGWDAVFIMLVVGALSAGLLLSRLVLSELSEKFSKRLACEQHNSE